MDYNISQTRWSFNSNILIILLLSCVYIILSSCSHIKPAPTKENIDAIIIGEMAKQNIVGLALGIVSNDGYYYTKGYGHEDLARTKPITQNTVFRWASISKVLTAIAVLKLDEEKANFNINDKVTKHVSYWSKKGNKGDILIKQLLSHRSGIIHFDKKENCPGNPNPKYDKTKHNEKKYNAVEAVDVFKDQKLCFNPGDNSKYSNFGYNLLGSAIEETSSKGYVKYVNKNIRDPLGMKSLRPATDSESKGFTQKCQILKNKSSGNLLYILPGGGWESNIIDLAKFANGIINGSILNDTNRLWTTVKNNIIYGTDYGYGIFHEDNKNKVWHGGKLDDVKTLLYLYPNSYDRLGIVLMVNGGEYVDVERISYQLAELFGQNHDYKEDSIVHTCDTDDDCPGKFSGVWRKTDKDILLRRGYKDDDFGKEWKFLRAAGYYTDDFEPYIKDGQVLWDAVFRKGEGNNGMWRNSSENEFLEKIKSQKAINTRLVDIETYVVDGKRKWAGLFRPASGKDSDMDWNLSREDFKNKRIIMKNNGFKLIDMEVYFDGEKEKWVGVWVEGEGEELRINYSSENFGKLWKSQNKNGWRLIDIERYYVNNQVRWAGIWEKSLTEEKLNRGWQYCEIVDFHNDYRNNGFELIDWEYY